MKLSKWLQRWFVLTYATPSLSGKQWVTEYCGGNASSQYNHVHLNHPSSHDELPYSFQTLPVDLAVIGQSFIYSSSDDLLLLTFIICLSCIQFACQEYSLEPCCLSPLP